jgi:hypothetical protein
MAPRKTGQSAALGGLYGRNQESGRNTLRTPRAPPAPRNTGTPDSGFYDDDDLDGYFPEQQEPVSSSPLPEALLHQNEQDGHRIVEYNIEAEEDAEVQWAVADSLESVWIRQADEDEELAIAQSLQEARDATLRNQEEEDLRRATEESARDAEEAARRQIRLETARGQFEAVEAARRAREVEEAAHRQREEIARRAAALAECEAALAAREAEEADRRQQREAASRAAARRAREAEKEARRLRNEAVQRAREAEEAERLRLEEDEVQRAIRLSLRDAEQQHSQPLQPTFVGNEELLGHQLPAQAERFEDTVSHRQAASAGEAQSPRRFQLIDEEAVTSENQEAPVSRGQPQLQHAELHLTGWNGQHQALNSNVRVPTVLQPGRQQSAQPITPVELPTEPIYRDERVGETPVELPSNTPKPVSIYELATSPVPENAGGLQNAPRQTNFRLPYPSTPGLENPRRVETAHRQTYAQLPYPTTPVVGNARGLEAAPRQTSAPLASPVPRRQPLPSWLKNRGQRYGSPVMGESAGWNGSRPQSETTSSDSSSPSSPGPVNGPPTSGQTTPDERFFSSEESSKRAPEADVAPLSTLRQVDTTQSPVSTSALSASSTSTSQSFTTNNFHGPVVINNFAVAPEKKENLLKRALLNLGKTGSASAAKASVSNRFGNAVSHVQAGMGGLNFGGGRYVTAADFAPRIIDEAYDAQDHAEVPNEEFLASLEALQERHRTPASQHLQNVRPQANGSPVTVRNQPLQLVTPRSPSLPGTPVSRSALSPSISSMYASADPVGGLRVINQTPVHVHEFQDQVFGTSNTGDEMRSTTPSVLQAARNEALGYRVSGSPSSSPTPSQIRRRPLSSAANVPAHIAPTQYEQFPVPVPDADRNFNDTPDSMRGQNDSPTYQLPTLGRRHIHPAMMTELANVPTAEQDLAFTNSRAMMDADRFGHAMRTGFPVMQRRENDTPEPVVDRTLTATARAEKQEKDAQKRLRNKG